MVGLEPTTLALSAPRLQTAQPQPQTVPQSPPRPQTASQSPPRLLSAVFLSLLSRGGRGFFPCPSPPDWTRGCRTTRGQPPDWLGHACCACPPLIGWRKRSMPVLGAEPRSEATEAPPTPSAKNAWAMATGLSAGRCCCCCCCCKNLTKK